MATISFSTELETVECANCAMLFAIPARFQNKVRQTHETFYCPQGHNNYYPGETAEEKLRKELKRKEQELANTVIEKVQLSNKLQEAERKAVRVKNGVCPCCNRTFKNLAAHMKTKHPKAK